jgi:Lipocalin-like domain
MRHLILYLFITAFFISSCNDHLKIEKNNDQQGYADSQLVGSWKITALSSDVAYDWNNDGSPERDIYSTWSPCERDNLFTFTSDTAVAGYKKGTFKINCSVTKSGDWQIVNAKDLVYVPLGLGPESERIINMTSIQFQSILLLTLNGQPATITKTWTRQ